MNAILKRKGNLCHMDYQEEKLESQEGGISLLDIFEVLKKNWLVIFLVTALFLAIGYVYVKMQPPVYTAQSTYIVYAKDNKEGTGSSYEGDLIESLSASDISRSKSFKMLCVEDLKSSNQLPNTLRLWLATAYGYSSSELPSASSIRSMLSFSSDDESYFFFTVTVTSSNRQLVMDLNAALSDVLSDAYRSSYEYAVLSFALADIKPLSPESTDAEKAEFKALLDNAGVAYETTEAFSSDLAALLSRYPITDDNRTRLFGYAKYDSTPIDGSRIYHRDASETPGISGSSLIYAVVAAGIGFVLSAGAFVLIRIFDTKIRTEEDLRKHCPYPTLAVIPAMHRSNKGGKH